MALLRSNAPEIGAPCPDFSLASVVDGRHYSLSDFDTSRALLIAFICNHCPYVRAIEDRLIALARSFSINDFQLVGICPNDAISYPDDAPAELRRRSEEKNYGFPYLFDEDQSVAKAFDAMCTPDLFLYDQNRHLFYHGQLDDNWQHGNEVKDQSLKNAINDILEGNDPPSDQTPSMGCSIKWKI